jgi:hypothetical protein
LPENLENWRTAPGSGQRPFLAAWESLSLRGHERDQQAPLKPLRPQGSRVGAGRPLLGRPYPPHPNRTCDFSPHPALTFP